jgi:hypothetical protein
MNAPKVNGRTATAVIELKDRRFLLIYDNGFSYYVLSAKNELTPVTEKYWREQLRKHRLTKNNRNKTI